MKNNMRIHHLGLEGKYFEDFIISSFIKDGLCDERNSSCETQNKFDAFLPKGIPDYIKREVYIDIKFANNPRILERNIQEINDYYVCYIGMFEKNIINDQYAVLGKKFVFELAKKHPELWWNFISYGDGSSQIMLSQDGKDAIMKVTFQPLGTERFVSQIKINEIHKISEMNEHEFVRLIAERKNKKALILGNGVSIPFGSDSWSEMIDSLFDYLQPYYIDSKTTVKKTIGDSNYFAASMAKSSIDKNKYYNAIKNSIYRKYDLKMHNEYTLLHSIAVAKHKFHNMPIVTFNYDNFLENDLKIFYPSFNIKAVSSAKSNKKTAEPKIMHVHGYCEDNKSKVGNLILTDEEYYKAYKGSSWVVKEQKRLLKDYICLYVGSSMSDLFQMSLIEEVSTEMNKKDGALWKCFALVCLKGLTPKDILAIYNYYNKKAIRIIFVDDFSKLPETLKKLMQI
ncbi:MAG: SIR2 family protein [Clostridia bacterium]|nr:SIR2 family protein [Clostridia bacterium]